MPEEEHRREYQLKKEILYRTEKALGALETNNITYLGFELTELHRLIKRLIGEEE